MNAEDAKGTILDRSVVGAVLATPGGRDWGTGGEMVRRCWLRRRRRRKSSNKRINANPATPPTTPPATAPLLIELPPPDPALELAVEEGADPVLPEPPIPPPRIPVLVDAVLDVLEELWLKEAEDEENVVCDDARLPIVEVREELRLILKRLMRGKCCSQKMSGTESR